MQQKRELGFIAALLVLLAIGSFAMAHAQTSTASTSVSGSASTTVGVGTTTTAPAATTTTNAPVPTPDPTVVSTPGVPNTGMGGDVTTNVVTLVISAFVIAAGTAYIVRRSAAQS